MHDKEAPLLLDGERGGFHTDGDSTHWAQSLSHGRLYGGVDGTLPHATAASHTGCSAPGGHGNITTTAIRAWGEQPPPRQAARRGPTEWPHTWARAVLAISSGAPSAPPHAIPPEARLSASHTHTHHAVVSSVRRHITAHGALLTADPPGGAWVRCISQPGPAAATRLARPHHDAAPPSAVHLGPHKG